MRYALSSIMDGFPRFSYLLTSNILKLRNKETLEMTTWGHFPPLFQWDGRFYAMSLLFSMAAWEPYFLSLSFFFFHCSYRDGRLYAPALEGWHFPFITPYIFLSKYHLSEGNLGASVTESIRHSGHIQLIFC